jgi:hypothetical protein
VRSDPAIGGTPSTVDGCALWDTGRSPDPSIGVPTPSTLAGIRCGNLFARAPMGTRDSVRRAKTFVDTGVPYVGVASAHWARHRRRTQAPEEKPCRP